jgi:hypothetical protein
MSRFLAAVSLGCVIGLAGCNDEPEESSSPAVSTGTQTPLGNNPSTSQPNDATTGANEDILVDEANVDDTTAPDLNITQIDPGVPSFDSLMEETFGGDFAGFDDFDFGFDEDQPLPPFEAVTLEEFDASWKTSFTASGEPAGAVLKELTAECGFTLEEQPELAAALETPVTLELADVNRLQIIEEVCNQAGLYPRYRLDRMKLSEGPRPLPIAFVGPFLVEARDLQEQVPYGTGSIAVQLTACTMSRDANSWLQSEGDGFGPPLATIEGVRGSGDVDLVDADGIYVENPTASATVVRFRINQNLKNLLRGVEEIESISGTIAFRLPSEVLSHTFNELAVGQSAQLGEIHVELSTIDLGSDSTIGFTTMGGLLDHRHVTAFDANGIPVESGGYSSTGSTGDGELYVYFSGEPASLVVKSIAVTTDVTYPFELTGVALQHAHEMPESIEPLTFEGESPVTLTYLRTAKDDFDNEVFIVEAVNHSNKDLSFLQIDVVFLDSNGAELGTFPHSQNGFPAVEANGTAEIEISKFFAAEGTVSIRPSLVEVRSMDALTWKAAE